MAEALGIAAAITQLIDLGGRVLIHTSRFVSNFKNVPRKIATIRCEIRHFIELLQLLEQDLDNRGGILASPSAPRSHSLSMLGRLLSDANQQTYDLAIILEEISIPQRTRIRKAWNAIVTMKKEDEILNRSRLVECSKSALQLWYQRQSLAMAYDQM